jgi:hypothetical protein
MVACMGLRLDVIRKHITSLDVASMMNTRDISFLAYIIYAETIFWSWSKT